MKCIEEVTGKDKMDIIEQMLGEDFRERIEKCNKKREDVKDEDSITVTED